MKSSKLTKTFKSTTNKESNLNIDKDLVKNSDTNKIVSKSYKKKDLSNLLDYYRLKINSFENERRDYLEKLEKLKLTQEEQHNLEWENKKRTEEIIELQNIISLNNEVLNKERRQMLLYQFELENKSHKSKEDRRRLMDLLKLAEPIEQTIKLYYDRRPDIKEKYAIHDNKPINKHVYENVNESNNIIKNSKLLRAKSPVSLASKETNNTNNILKRNNSRTKLSNKIKIQSSKTSYKDNKNVTNKEYRISPIDDRQNIIRTVILPKEQENLLSQEVEYLKKQINQIRQFYEDQLNKYNESKKLQEEENKLSLLALNDKIELLLKKNHKLEKLNYEITKDYMHLKFDSSTNEKRLYEEIELIKLHNESLSKSIHDLTSKNIQEKQFNKNIYERRRTEISTNLRNQIKSHQEQNNLIKEQYKQIQNMYNENTANLSIKLKEKIKKFNILENKRKNDLKGFLAEINLIRQKIFSYENYIFKLKQYSNVASNIDNTKQIKADIDLNEKDFLKGTNDLKIKLDSMNDRLQASQKDFEDTVKSNIFDFRNSSNLNDNNKIDELENISHLKYKNNNIRRNSDFSNKEDSQKSVNENKENNLNYNSEDNYSYEDNQYN